MKIVRMIATAGLLVASLGATTAASAQNYGGDRQYQADRQDQRYDNDRRDHYDRYDRNRDERRGNYDRRDRYDRHDDRRNYGHHYGWRNGRGYHRCHIEWRHHREVRVCR